MKIYHGVRMGTPKVYVSEGAAYYPLPFYQNIYNHSPEGFEWGYGGSGPAQLALAILADHFGPQAPPQKCPYCDGPMRHWKCTEMECAYDGEKAGDNWKHIQGGICHYQEFKRDLIAKLPKEEFKITQAEIVEWLKSQKPNRLQYL